jgi:hypothetical protein
MDSFIFLPFYLIPPPPIIDRQWLGKHIQYTQNNGRNVGCDVFTVVCVPTLVPRQWLGKHVPVATKTAGGIIFYVVSVIPKKVGK